jgi:hypothetical protein
MDDDTRRMVDYLLTTIADSFIHRPKIDGRVVIDCEAEFDPKPLILLAESVGNEYARRMFLDDIDLDSSEHNDLYNQAHLHAEK